MQRHGCPDLDPGQPAAGEHTVMVWHKGQAYGQDLRDRVLNARGSIREMVVRFGVNKSYVARARSPLRRHSKDTPAMQPRAAHTQWPGTSLGQSGGRRERLDAAA